MQQPDLRALAELCEEQGLDMARNSHPSRKQISDDLRDGPRFHQLSEMYGVLRAVLLGRPRRREGRAACVGAIYLDGLGVAKDVGPGPG